jgi:Xaa-Pro aminopeptidase
MKNQKLAGLRDAMKGAGVDAYIIPNTDSHQSEYFSEYYRSMTWLSGFTGSNGTIVVTQDFAGLWTDGRYFLQASQQLEGSGIEMMKLEVQINPEYIQWIADNLSENGTVGIDGKLFSISQFDRMQRLFKAKNIQVKTDLDLIDGLWTDRPVVNGNTIFEHFTMYAGQSRADKITAIRAKMETQQVENYLITALDDLAWTFNIRGSDVSYNPVTYGYAVIAKDKAYLFIQPSKVSKDLKFTLENTGVELHDYHEITDFLESLENSSILLSSGQTSVWLKDAIPSSCRIIKGKSIAQDLKGIKNETEQEWLREVMVKDGVAMVKFIKWVEDNVGKERITELSASNRLHEFRAEQDAFIGDSFPAISGYKGNGAIIHYKVTPETDTELYPDGIYLIDSGGQYLDGTTDITRTLTLGTPTEEQVKMYTLVLKGHIGLAKLKFPEGTRGNQLDVMARQPLWQHGLNFRHGTGHGVGFFMNVHEGPQSIGPGNTGKYAIPMKAGMYSSNEPGFYKEGEFGIRIENLIIAQKVEETDYGQFLEFETITLCPLENRLVDVSLLEDSERQWYNDYHQEVFDKISPRLDDEEKSWLAEKCKAI